MSDSFSYPLFLRADQDLPLEEWLIVELGYKFETEAEVPPMQPGDDANEEQQGSCVLEVREHGCQPPGDFRGRRAAFILRHREANRPRNVENRSTFRDPGDREP